jgi:hypothetical protein
MAAQPIARQSMTPMDWDLGKPVYSSSYQVAGLRAGLIALVLLAIFVVIVLV